MTELSIAIKPHHFVDILTSFGAGERTFYPHPYGHSVNVVSETVLRNPEVILIIELGADEICKPCIHNKNGLCDDVIDISNRPSAPSSKREWNLLIDNRWCDRIMVKQGDMITAGEMSRRILAKKGNISDIYREINDGGTAERERQLTEGIRFYLKDRDTPERGD